MNPDITSSQILAALVTLAEIGETVSANLPLDVLLGRIVNALTRLVLCDVVTVMIPNLQRQTATIRASVDRTGQTVISIGSEIPLKELPTLQEILRTGELLYIPDVSLSPLWNNRLNTLPDGEIVTGQIRACLGLPLILQEHVVGVLFIDFYTTHPMTDDLRYTSLAFARFAAAAIYNAQQREAQQRSEERYRLAANLTSDAIYEWEPGASTIEWLGDIDHLLRYKDGEFPRTDAAWLNAIHPNDRKRVQLARELIVQDGVRFEEEYRIRRADETYCHVIDRAMRFGDPSSPRILGAITDLTNTYELTDALLESEVRYRTLFVRALDAVFVVDREGRMMDVNPAAEALTGRDYAQLRSLTMDDLILPEELDAYSAAIQQVYDRGEFSNLELSFQRADGSRLEIEMWGSALGGDHYQLVARDVSAWRQAQTLAAQRIAELTALSDVTRITSAGGDLAQMLDRVLQGAMSALEVPMGCIYLREGNDTTMRLSAQCGFPPGLNHVPEYLSVYAAERGRVTSFSSLVRLIDHPQPSTGPYVSMQVPLISNGNILGLVLFSETKPRVFMPTDICLMDIIGRQLGIGVENVRLLDKLELLVQERTSALWATETRYKSLIEQVPGVVYTADTVHSGLSFVSSGTENLFGVSPAEMMAMESALITSLNPEDLPWVNDLANHAIMSGEDFDAQYRIKNARTGQERWVHHRARLIIAGTGETFWLGLLTDVTNLKELDNLKNQFVATVSHELRTPLSAIKLRAATLKNYYSRLSDDQRLDMVERITYQADILAELIEDVLRLAKLDGGNVDRQIEEMDLVNAASDVLEELRPSIDASALEVTTIWSVPKCVIQADVTDISRIWRNLISNAVKYTSAPGKVDIYVGNVCIGEDRNVMVSTIPVDQLVIPPRPEAGEWAVGIVQDSGKGISEYDQAHIFTRFFRGEAALTSIPGTGLGLSLVKELLDDYGGFVGLRSIPGEGSSFVFWMPAARIQK